MASVEQVAAQIDAILDAAHAVGEGAERGEPSRGVSGEGRHRVRRVARHVDVLPVRPLARQVRLDLNERRRVRVVDLEILAARHGPNALIAIGSHRVEHLHFALHDLAVGLAVDEDLEARAVGPREAVLPLHPPARRLQDADAAVLVHAAGRDLVDPHGLQRRRLERLLRRLDGAGTGDDGEAAAADREASEPDDAVVRVHLAADQLVGGEDRLHRFDRRMAFEMKLGEDALENAMALMQEVRPHGWGR